MNIFLIILSISGYYEMWMCVAVRRATHISYERNQTILTARLSRHDSLRAGRSPSVGSLMAIRRATPRLALPVQITLPSERCRCFLPLPLPCNLSKLQHYDTRELGFDAGNVTTCRAGRKSQRPQQHDKGRRGCKYKIRQHRSTPRSWHVRSLHRD